MGKRDIALTNVMLKSLANNLQSEAALQMYDEQRIAAKVDNISHLMAICACAKTKNYEKGKQIHSKLTNPMPLQLKTALIDFYGHCADIAAAQTVFASISDSEKNAVCVNAMMSALAENEKYDKALALYEDAKRKDITTHKLALKMCANLNEFERGKRIHKETLSDASDLSVEMKTTLIALYGHGGDIATAQSLYDSIVESERDIFCVDTMMEALCNNEQNNEC